MLRNRKLVRNRKILRVRKLVRSSINCTNFVNFHEFVKIYEIAKLYEFVKFYEFVKSEFSGALGPWGPFAGGSGGAAAPPGKLGLSFGEGCSTRHVLLSLFFANLKNGLQLKSG